MKSYTHYCKYLCLAAVAGVLVTGVPSQGNALDFGLSTIDVVADGLIAADAASTGVPVCGDVKGTACSPNGSVQKCQSKNGRRLCQTCTNGTWGSGYVGDCWGSGTTTYEAEDTIVLDRF
ncbi:MAG: hypothetical protein BroJett001_28470 [Chloroflexota bacterium]|nr:MAG: hypothetical protein BroJett001_28470 [Chloroflexota bacterium]